MTVRKMRPGEIGLALDWAKQEGWNPGLHDSICFFNTDNNGFFVAEEEKKIIGVISAVKYSHNYGFIGIYIVEKNYRGGAAGLLLARHAFDYLKNCNIGLDGVLERVENYKRIGFKFFCKNIRFSGSIQPNSFNYKDIVSIDRSFYPRVFIYDRSCFPADRVEFLYCWVRQPDHYSFCRKIGNKILGYGVIRKCDIGYKIGPLFADDSETAEMIFLKLCEAASFGLVYIDTPEINQQAVDLAKKYNLKECFATAGMYSKKEPEIDVQKIYGVTTFELG